jgi:hypothetical protein
MKKILVICATVATLGAAALSSAQASTSAAGGPAAAAIPVAYPGQMSNQPNAIRGPHDGELLGERRPDPNIRAYGFKFRLTNRESGAICGVWGTPCFY